MGINQAWCTACKGDSLSHVLKAAEHSICILRCPETYVQQNASKLFASLSFLSAANRLGHWLPPAPCLACSLR